MYVKAEDVLPADLLEAIQEYVQGVEIYIPKRGNSRLGWGERNGTKKALRTRNKEIRHKYEQGESIYALTEQYHLSYDSVRKIISQNKIGKIDSK